MGGEMNDTADKIKRFLNPKHPNDYGLSIGVEEMKEYLGDATMTLDQMFAEMEKKKIKANEN